MVSISMIRSIKRVILLVAAFIWCNINSRADTLPADSNAITIPLGGNGWVGKGARAAINEQGLTGWYAGAVSIYVRLETAGSLNIALRLRVPDGVSKISVTTTDGVLTKQVSNPDLQTIDFGTVTVKKPGYIKFNLTGITKTGGQFADITDMILSGPAGLKTAAYVKDNHGNYYYWGHRGPSVHLNYKLPDQAAAEWFYNEVTVPTGQDVQGSYFMADGFTGGYFGMQVNSATERHVLFSIWSPFNTDDPKSIPDSMKIQLLKKGQGVHAGEFGSEGSGGQSYMNYPWVAGKTYAFLVHAEADAVAKNTIFTAYFKPADAAAWQLIASFKRPVSGFYLKGIYSFLENFEPDMGTVTRKVFFGNQWFVDIAGNWHPLTKALFTGDATAKINYRKDYGGGVNGSLFYLRNCGFFDDFTTLKTNLVRQSAGSNHPQIDLKKLILLR